MLWAGRTNLHSIFTYNCLHLPWWERHTYCVHTDIERYCVGLSFSVFKAGEKVLLHKSWYRWEDWKTTSLQLQHMKFVYILTTFVVFIDCRISKQETKQFSPAVFVGGNLDCYLHRWEIHMYCLMVQFDWLVTQWPIFAVEIGKLDRCDCLDMSEVSDRSPLQSLSD